MRCAELKSVLALNDADLRLRPADARSHLDDCLLCREEFPEVALMLASQPVVITPAVALLPRRMPWRLPVGIAAAVIAAIVFATNWPQQEAATGAIGGIVAPKVAEYRGSDRGVVIETETLVVGPRGAGARVTNGTWYSPTPSALRRQ